MVEIVTIFTFSVFVCLFHLFVSFVCDCVGWFKRQVACECIGVVWDTFGFNSIGFTFNMVAIALKLLHGFFHDISNIQNWRCVLPVKVYLMFGLSMQTHFLCSTTHMLTTIQWHELECETNNLCLSNHI